MRGKSGMRSDRMASMEMIPKPRGRAKIELSVDCANRKLSNKEAINEVAGGKTGAHGLECLEIFDELRAVLKGEIPEGFVLDNFEGKVPSFGAMLAENLPVGNFQIVGGHKCFVIVHDF